VTTTNKAKKQSCLHSIFVAKQANQHLLYINPKRGGAHYISQNLYIYFILTTPAHDT